MKIYNVSELNIEAREAILAFFEYPVSVKGEITDYRVSRGHQYFKLRDPSSGSTVSCVIWKSSTASLEVSTYINMEVIVTARVDFYAGFGQFQLNVMEVSEYGDGFLKKEIERLKKKLSEEGVFDNKKEIPKFPKNIGILTANNSHAMMDVCSKLNEKYPLACLHVYPTLVQGNNAPANLIKQIKKINSDQVVDVILIVRGGGSLQDLMAFNDESFVREISKSSIPTITGIGHEPDITLSDYASDLTKETPTAAAMAAVPDIQVIRSSLLQLDLSLGRVVSKKFEFLTERLSNLSSLIKVNAPYKKVISFARNFKLYTVQLKNAMNLTLKKNQVVYDNELNNQTKALKHIKVQNINSVNNLKIYKNMIFNTLSNRLIQLEELVKLKSHHIQQINPKNILKKGYAIIRDKQDKIIKNSENAKHHRLFTIEMIDGRIEVERKKKKGLL